MDTRVKVSCGVTGITVEMDFSDLILLSKMSAVLKDIDREAFPPGGNVLVPGQMVSEFANLLDRLLLKVPEIGESNIFDPITDEEREEAENSRRKR